MYAFHSNFLSMLVSPSMEKPLDTAEDILAKGLIPIAKAERSWKKLMQDSPNRAEQKLAENMLFTEDFQQTDIILDKVLLKRTHVWIISYIEDPYHLPYDAFHISKDAVAGSNPWFAWIVNRKLVLREFLDRHILFYQQVYLHKCWGHELTCYYFRQDLHFGPKRCRVDGEEERGD